MAYNPILPLAKDASSNNADLAACLGMEFTDNDGVTRRLIQVHASSTSAIAAKSACYLYDAAVEDVVNTEAILANASLFVGVGEYAIPVGYYGWVVVEGPVLVNTNDASSVSTQTVGAALYGCSTDGALRFADVAAVSSLSVYLGYRVVGTVALAYSSSSGTRKVLAKIRK